MTSKGIYLDNNATTPCDPRVVEKMLPYFNESYGNPSNGLHALGRAAARAVDLAREQVAALIGARPHEILFTGGATESDNLAILGLARRQAKGKRRRIVTSAVEHKAVLLPCKYLAEMGFDVVILPVDRFGVVSVVAAQAAINEDTLLVSVQLANNEVGSLQPVQAIAGIAHHFGALIHTDAAQAVGKIPVQVDELGIDLLSLSGHKFYGPKGVGGLYVRGGSNAIPLEPLVIGGGQESGIRPGTSNVPGIVGIGAASEVCAADLVTVMEQVATLRNQLEQTLIGKIPGLAIHGDLQSRLPNTSSLTFPGVDADALLLNLTQVMLGTGSACSSGAIEPSHVLQAMGVSREDAHRTVRASLGRYTSHVDVILAAEQIVTAWQICSTL